MRNNFLVKLVFVVLLVTLAAGCLSQGSDVKKPTQYSEVIQTKKGNLTIQSSLPIIVYNESMARNATNYTNFKSYTCYGMEAERNMRDYYVVVVVIDRPHTAGALPDFSPLDNITFMNPDGSISRAISFKAWKSVEGKLLLDVKSENMTGISLLKTDGTSQDTYVLNGTSIPIKDFAYSEKTAVILVEDI